MFIIKSKIAPDKGSIITESARIFDEWIRTREPRHLKAWSRLLRSAPAGTFSMEARP